MKTLYKLKMLLKIVNMKILCKLFGHPDRPHYHERSSVISCDGGCEKWQKVYEITECPRCGAWEKDLTNTGFGKSLKEIIEQE